MQKVTVRNLKMRFPGAIALGILIVLLLAGCAGDHKANVEGIWGGVLNIRGVNVRVAFNISKTPDGMLTAVMLRPELGDEEIPVRRVILEGDHLKLEVFPGEASFDGYVKPDQAKIEGQWDQGEFSQPLVLSKVSEVPKPVRPQEPKPPYPYEEQDALYADQGGEHWFAGTLTLPREGGPFAAVLLVSGAGSQDRDGLIMGHRPFLVMADYLTRQGIAVLRVDDRGVGGSTGDRSEATSEDYAQDVLAGVKYLKSHPKIDPRRIGLIGYAEGGTVASLAAAHSRDVAFIVMLAAQGLPGEEYNYQFEESINRVLGMSDEAIDSILAVQKRVFAVLKSEADTARARVRVRQILENLTPPMPQPVVESNLERYLSPWFRWSITYDPAKTLRKVKCPVLALFGAIDVQVRPEGNLEAVEKALKSGGNRDYRAEVLPGLNHLFQTAFTGAPSEYAKIEQTIAPKALEVIATWILDHVKK